MPDRMTKEQRSYCMSRIRSTNTKPERLFESGLRRAGLKFAKHAADLPGKPDFVFERERVAVFIHGDFWHGWQYGRLRKRLPRGYWQEKIERNRNRDRKNRRKLKAIGWYVLRFWEHEVVRNPNKCLQELSNLLEDRYAIEDASVERRTCRLGVLHVRLQGPGNVSVWLHSS